MEISKEQWQQIETELSSPMGCVKLTCDGYPLTLSVERYDTLKYGIRFYIDGHFLGKWMIADCEERRRFFQPMEIRAYGTKMRSDLIKIWGGKRAPKAKVAEINKKITTYRHYWVNAKALRRHLQKHNENIELVSIGF